MLDTLRCFLKGAHGGPQITPPTIVSCWQLACWGPSSKVSDPLRDRVDRMQNVFLSSRKEEVPGKYSWAWIGGLILLLWWSPSIRRWRCSSCAVVRLECSAVVGSGEKSKDWFHWDSSVHGSFQNIPSERNSSKNPFQLNPSWEGWVSGVTCDLWADRNSGFCTVVETYEDDENCGKS